METLLEVLGVLLFLSLGWALSGAFIKCLTERKERNEQHDTSYNSRR